MTMSTTPREAGDGTGSPAMPDAADVPVRMTPGALGELERLFPGDDLRHVRVIAAPG